MSRLPISVCIIAKNEEKYLEECLKCLKPYDMEIVVTDTGSTDRTKEIASKYADKVLDFEWINDFSAARNYCAEHAKNDWIFAIDCDEYVNDLKVKELRWLMNKFPDYLGAVQMKNLIRTSDGKQTFMTDTIARLYNKKKYKFSQSVHEQITPIDPNVKMDALRAFMIPMELVHHGYDIGEEDMKKKQERNLRLLHEKFDNGDKDPYIYFQLGQSYFIIGEIGKAIDYYKEGLAKNPDIELLYVQEMVMSLVKAYMKVGEQNAALELLDKYSNNCKSAKYAYIFAGVYMDTEHYYKALLQYIKTTTLKDFDTIGAGKLDCYTKIILLLQSMNQFEIAKLYEDKFKLAKEECERVLCS